MAVGRSTFTPFCVPAVIWSATPPYGRPLSPALSALHYYLVDVGILPQAARLGALWSPLSSWSSSCPPSSAAAVGRATFPPSCVPAVIWSATPHYGRPLSPAPSALYYYPVDVGILLQAARYKCFLVAAVLLEQQLPAEQCGGRPSTSLPSRLLDVVDLSYPSALRPSRMSLWCL